MALTHMCRVIQPRWLALVPSHRRTCAHASSHARTNTQALSLSRECTGGVRPPMPTASQYTAAFFRLFSPMAHGMHMGRQNSRMFSRKDGRENRGRAWARRQTHEHTTCAHVSRTCPPGRQDCVKFSDASGGSHRNLNIYEMHV